MEYTLTLQSQEDYRLIKKLLKAFDGASIRPIRKSTSHIEQEDSKEDLTSRICNSLRQVKLIQEGKLPRRTVEDMLNEL